MRQRASDAGGDDTERARLRMVARQLRRRGVRDPRVLAAMASVPRERFVPPELRPDAVSYTHLTLPTTPYV